MAKPRLLFIPHTPLTHVLETRGQALARGLTRDFRVHFLSWYYNPLDERSYLRRSLSRLSGLLKFRRMRTEGDVAVITTPLLYVRREGLEIVRRLNTAIVNKVIEAYGIDVVINELAVVNSRDLKRPCYIDIVDLPTPGETERWCRQAARAAGITTITAGVRDELRKHGLEAEVIPNGADVAKFRAASGETMRRRLGLHNCFLIGYIGNHAEWSGLGFMLDVFGGIKQEIPEAALLIVGPGTEVPKARARAEHDGIADVVFTGPVNTGKVAEYFGAIDLAVLPFELDPHANLSFPIKIVEYGAARKIVVASPLRVLRDVAFPNVHLVERQVLPWVEAILTLRGAKWQPEWDWRIEEYDWQNLSRRLAAYVTKARKIPLGSNGGCDRTASCPPSSSVGG